MQNDKCFFPSEDEVNISALLTALAIVGVRKRRSMFIKKLSSVKIIFFTLHKSANKLYLMLEMSHSMFPQKNNTCFEKY